MSDSLNEVFSENGVLAQHISGYTPRASQIALAEGIASAIDSQQTFVAEAPTGVGKTFAYLVPALLSGKKVIVSTGTKNLQDQLFSRDVPFLLKALQVPVRVALLKGRQNYLCHYRIEYNATQGLFPDVTTQKEFQLIKKNVGRFLLGDIAEYNDVPENSLAWSFVTSTADNCLGKNCPYLKDCYLFKARQNAQKADVVVINHHLFFADCALKDEGFGEILPSAEVVIFDEAHQMPQVATHFFGQRLSSRQLNQLLADVLEAQKELAKDDRTLIRLIEAMSVALNDFVDALGEWQGKHPWDQLIKTPKVKKALPMLETELATFVTYLSEIEERSEDMAALAARATLFYQLVKTLPQANVQSQNTNDIYWVEIFKRSVIFNQTPLSIAAAFQAVLQPKTSYIYTSATLSVEGEFNYFLDNLGISQAVVKQFDSAFDYYQQSLFYLPRGMPDPRDPTYIPTLVDRILPILRQLKGRTFLLFTSFVALDKARECLTAHDETFNYFVQGSAPKNQLVQKFLETEQAVLLGTSSFWEGVDVKGAALSCVVIDKLPFESPYDPVTQARLRLLKQRGLEPFHHYQLPLAVITLKQGLGRLMRDEKDKGIFVVGDPRLSARMYGAVFFDSLPRLNKTRDQGRVLKFAETEL